MKFITRLINGVVFALVGFFAMHLFGEVSLNISLLTGLGAFILVLILSSPTLNKMIKKDIDTIL